MNTAFEYLYRDAANYKSWGRVIFSGEFTQDIWDKLNSCLNPENGFIAHQVDVPEVFSWLNSEDEPTNDDHVWHEFHQLVLTDNPPTHPQTIEEFIDFFVIQSQQGWHDGWAPGDSRPLRF